MRSYKLIVVLVMIFNSASARAEWIPIAAVPKFLGYADLDNIEVTDDARQVWVLQNYLEHQTKGFLSVRARCEYECSTNRGRVVAEEWWTEHWARGTNVTPANTAVDQRWIQLTPGSFGELILKIVCAGAKDH